jgi:hypothetical protein
MQENLEWCYGSEAGVEEEDASIGCLQVVSWVQSMPLVLNLIGIYQSVDPIE